jgi:hypothetical protein
MTENEILRATSTGSAWRRQQSMQLATDRKRASSTSATAIAKGLGNSSLKGFGAAASGGGRGENEVGGVVVDADDSDDDDDDRHSRSQSKRRGSGDAQSHSGSEFGSGDKPIRHMDGEPLLSNNALWDYIVEHPLVRAGHVDIADACDRLRRLAKPGMQGPVFFEAQVKEAIEQSRRGGGDALI